MIAALDRLSAIHRAVLILHHHDGHSVKEVAELLGRSAEAVESLLSRARRGLASVLEGVTP